MKLSRRSVLQSSAAALGALSTRDAFAQGMAPKTYVIELCMRDQVDFGPQRRLAHAGLEDGRVAVVSQRDRQRADPQQRLFHRLDAVRGRHRRSCSQPM